jgi:hypothetical protein
MGAAISNNYVATVAIDQEVSTQGRQGDYICKDQSEIPYKIRVLLKMFGQNRIK